MSLQLPKILVIDDFFGRTVPGGNRDRDNLCRRFSWIDETKEDACYTSLSRPLVSPGATVVFHRGQQPACAEPGNVVRNDLDGVLSAFRGGWQGAMDRGEAPWSLVLVDLCFYTGFVTEESHSDTPGMPEGCAEDNQSSGYFGLQVLEAIHREFPEAPLLVFSSKPRDEVSLTIAQCGALGFVGRSEPDAPYLFRSALDTHGLYPDFDGDISGQALPLLLALREARRGAKHRGNLLIRGERGAGKELMAAFVHKEAERYSGALARPYVPVNSAVLTSDMASAELFGIEPKTATGVDGKIGLIESAQGGDLFLDEIADMPSEAQASMLRTLQDRKVTRVGGRAGKAVDVRFISATNITLEEAHSGFRSDLLDRLRLGGTIHVPALRERKADIPLLVQKFTREAEAATPGALFREISKDALDLLVAHDWPGNVRELRGCVFEAVTRFPSVEHLLAEHIRIAERVDVQVVAPWLTSPASGHVGFDRLMEQMTVANFAQDSIEAWAGKLDELQKAHARVLGRFLQAAIDATRKRTPEEPQGKVMIHPAVRMMAGDGSLTAAKAADQIKRMLSSIEAELEGDLLTAYETALRLRPRGNPKSRKKL